MDKAIDCYMDFDIEYDVKTEERIVKLINPFPVNRRDDLYVSLVYMTYRDESSAYYNAPESVFEFLMPKCTRPKATKTDEKSPFATPEAQFVYCTIENAEYNPETLCQSLNKELQNKMPSLFRPNNCKFIWNANIARVEISIDGSLSLDPDSRATLTLYNNLAYFLGFTNLRQGNVSVSFGAPYGKVTSGHIVQTSHGTAGYSPKLPRPEFIFWFLNVLEKQVGFRELFLMKGVFSIFLLIL